MATKRPKRYEIDKQPSSERHGAHVWWIMDNRNGSYMVRVRELPLAQRICRLLNAKRKSAAEGGT